MFMTGRYHLLQNKRIISSQLGLRYTYSLQGKDSLVIVTLGLILLQLNLVDNFRSSQYSFGVIK
jgi:hypothetical protein